MGTASRIDHELEEKNDFLRQLIDMGHLDGAALGITKQVIDRGEESLSPKQKFVFQQNVLDEFVTAECRRDGGSPV
jgi:hypothetical protein